eukprot:7062617-Pyramimonas_sp.AAC.1
MLLSQPHAQVVHVHPPARPRSFGHQAIRRGLNDHLQEAYRELATRSDGGDRLGLTGHRVPYDEAPGHGEV